MATAVPSSTPSAAATPHGSHLGDFTLDRRTLRIIALALPLGAASALVATLLLRLIGLITNLVFYRRWETDLVAPGVAHSPWLLVLVAPIIGGLIVGLMARYGSEKIRGHGMPEAIEAILTGGSKVSPRVAVLKPISAAITIGTGGPFGAEGPIIMTGGAVGSVMAQFLRLSADERKTLLVAGAAGGMAATFNAPLASILLAVELLLFEWRPRSYLPVAASVAVSTIVRGLILGTAPVFPVPDVVLHLNVGTYVCCLAAGVLGGLLAVGATRIVYFAEDTFARLPIHWMWWPAIGGLIIGVGGLIEPRALGVGYDVISELLTGKAGMSLVIGILVVKTLIWSLSLGSGTSGGVLAPVFMIGGALGALEGLVFPQVGPGFWALMGLGAVVGGVMRSPFTGIIFSLELTHEWGALLPLIVVASTAYGVSALLLKRSVLTEKIARRGFHLTREYSIDPLEVLFVRDVMNDDAVAFDAGVTVREVLEEFTSAELDERDRHHRQRLYPIVDDSGQLTGIVSRRDLLDALREPALGSLPIETIAVAQPVVAHPEDTLRDVAYRFAEAGVTRAPVTESDTGVVVGVVTLTQLLEGRLRDLEEERHVERVLRLPLVPQRRKQAATERAAALGERAVLLDSHGRQTAPADSSPAEAPLDLTSGHGSEPELHA
ncbi:MAG: chloride channel protein [Actinomycetes bacterium]